MCNPLTPNITGCRIDITAHVSPSCPGWRVLCLEILSQHISVQCSVCLINVITLTFSTPRIPTSPAPKTRSPRTSAHCSQLKWWWLWICECGRCKSQCIVTMSYSNFFYKINDGWICFFIMAWQFRGRHFTYTLFFFIWDFEILLLSPPEFATKYIIN